MPHPAMIPQMAPAVVARFHQMPMTSAGKLPAMASENAQPTMARMSEGLVEASAAEATATSKSRTRATIKRFATSFALLQNGATMSASSARPPSNNQRHAIPYTGLGTAKNQKIPTTTTATMMPMTILRLSDLSGVIIL